MTPEQVLALKPKVLTQAQRESYFKDGFLLVERAIGQDWIAQAARRHRRAGRAQPQGDASPTRCSTSSPRTGPRSRGCGGCRTRWSSTRCSGSTA